MKRKILSYQYPQDKKRETIATLIFPGGQH